MWHSVKDSDQCGKTHVKVDGKGSLIITPFLLGYESHEYYKMVCKSNLRRCPCDFEAHNMSMLSIIKVGDSCAHEMVIYL